MFSAKTHSTFRATPAQWDFATQTKKIGEAGFHKRDLRLVAKNVKVKRAENQPCDEVKASDWLTGFRRFSPFVMTEIRHVSRS